jgi:hypothetical protein
MRAMRRRAVALVSALSVIAAALAAPMTHVHEGEGHGTHRRGAVVHAHESIHTHAVAHASAGAVLEGPDHEGGRVRAFDPFQMVRGFERPAVGLPPAVASAPPPAVRFARVRLLVQHGHDPPFAPLTASRAPPFPLS